MTTHSTQATDPQDAPKSLSQLPSSSLEKVIGVLTDVDDTLTSNGILYAETLGAIQQLSKQGIRVIPVTGASAGWCDHIAHCWGVPAVIGEGGAFYFQKIEGTRNIKRSFWYTEEERAEKKEALLSARLTVLNEFPGVVLASDQDYRTLDLAVDLRNSRGGMLSEDVQAEITRVLRRRGMSIKVSSVHINAYFGDYDKLSMACRMVRELWGEDLGLTRENWVFVGDSLNDASMFEFFPLSVGVSNVERVLPELCKMGQQPKYVTKREGGGGFTDLAYYLLEAKEGKGARTTGKTTISRTNSKNKAIT